MDRALIEAFESTDYLVCLDAAEWASIRVHRAPPPSLLARVGTRPWGFITAWNPRSEPHDWADNTAAQRELLAALRSRPETAAILPGIGVGSTGWHEPSLFVIGPDCAALDPLAGEYGQNAYVHGCGTEIARLRLLRR
jgi:hypothetical protein